MIFSNLWGRITGKDKRKQFPEQQGSVLGRLSDLAVIYPYGLYCDLPAESLVYAPVKGKAFPVTVKRPDDAAQGEVTIFHPETNTRIVFRNGKDIDIEVGTGNLNVSASNIVLNGEVAINGNLVVSGTVNADDVTADNQDVTLSTHGHPALNTPPTPGT